MFSHYLFATLVVFGLMIRSCGPEPEPLTTEAFDRPVVDSLLDAYSELRLASLGSDAEDVIRLLDPDHAGELQQISRQHGYQSLRSYLDRQLVGWPRPDSLELLQLVTSAEYARLLYRNPDGSSEYIDGKVRFTAMLFRRTDRWRLSAITSVVKPRYDRYGYQMAIHETDLPPRLRFPRLF